MEKRKRKGNEAGKNSGYYKYIFGGKKSWLFSNVVNSCHWKISSFKVLGNKEFCVCVLCAGLFFDNFLSLYFYGSPIVMYGKKSRKEKNYDFIYIDFLPQDFLSFRTFFWGCYFQDFILEDFLPGFSFIDACNHHIALVGFTRERKQETMMTKLDVRSKIDITQGKKATLRLTVRKNGVSK